MFRILGSWVIGALVLACAGSNSTAQQQASSRSYRSHVALESQRIQQVSGGGLGLVRTLRDGTPHILIGHPGSGSVIVDASDLGEATKVASALQSRESEMKSLLGLPAEAELQSSGVDSTASLWHSTYGMSYHGIPVRDRKLNVNIGRLSGKYVSLVNELPVSAPLHYDPTVPVESLTARKLADLIGTGESVSVVSSPSLVYTASGSTGHLSLCYEATVRDTINAHLWRLTIDAMTGELLGQSDLLEYVEPRQRSGRVVAHVHPQSPFDSIRTVGVPNAAISIGNQTVVTDSLGYWNALCMDTSESASLLLANSGYFVSRGDSGSATLSALLDPVTSLVVLDDGNSRASERDAFYSVSNARSFARQLSPNFLSFDSLIAVRVDLGQSCNAFYDPSDHSLNFFRANSSCSNTAEIADVVYHEFGHHWVHSVYSGCTNGNIVNSALGEGFADIFSAFERDDSRIGIGFFANNCYSTLRDCFNTKSFPKDLSGDPHVTGQIISGSFWDLRRAVGRSNATRLFVDALKLHPDAPNSTLAPDIETGVMETLMDVIAVDDTDNDLTNGTPHLAEILTAFRKHGVSLANFIDLSTTRLPDFDSAASEYPVSVRAEYSGQIGELSDTSLWVYYSFDDGASFSRANLTRGADSLFAGRIPAAPAGTVVRYFVKASTTLDSVSAAYDPSPYSPAVFLVGYKSSYLDDCESDRGWMLSAPTDKAKTGLWVRDVPYGTFQSAGDFVQQDTDHSAFGTACYVTGNKLTRSFSEDDVDSGATTLTTPPLNLSQSVAPVIRYWYYYWNKYGFYANRAPFIVQISSDNGATWSTVQSTPDATDGWQSFTFRVSDKVTPSATTRLRFVAADYFATVIEAGVDDLEVLAAPPKEVATVSSTSSSDFTLSLDRMYAPRNSRIRYRVTSDRDRRVLVQAKNLFGDVVRTSLDQTVLKGETRSVIDLQEHPAGVYWIVASDGYHQCIRRLIVQ